MSIPSIAPYVIPELASISQNRVKWQVQSDRAVLLIHDMQEYFIGFYGAGNPMIEALITRIGQIKIWAKTAGIPVVYTAQPTLQSEQDRALLNDMWGPGLTKSDPKLSLVVSALCPDAEDTVLVKWRYSAFQRSPLQQIMSDWERDQLLIVGVYAHIGCMATALDAFMRDIQAFMVSDALADFSESEHRIALNYVASRCGAVIDSAQILQPSEQVIDLAWLKLAVMRCIDDAQGEIDLDDNLIDYGLDSVQVMGLVADWRKLGIRISFEELAKKTTLNAWWDLLTLKQAA
jgi:bifunctional isochorismate lyase/aryl carrier protein